MTDYVWVVSMLSLIIGALTLVVVVIALAAGAPSFVAILLAIGIPFAWLVEISSP